MMLAPVRPRFRLLLDDEPAAALARIEAAVAAQSERAVCRVLDGHIDIALARAERHRFSPCLQLEFSPRGEHDAVLPPAVRTIVHGLIGPHPNLWTLYAFVGLGFVTLLLFCGIFGGVQVALGESAWGFWGIPLSVAGQVGLYLISQYGQRTAAAQTAFLYGLVHDALAGVEIPDPAAATTNDSPTIA